ADAWRVRGRVVRLEHDRGLVAVRGQVAIEALDAGVEPAVGVPADVEVVGVEAGLADARGPAHPVQAPGRFGPEAVRVGAGPCVEPPVAVGVEVGGGGEGRGDGVTLRLGHGGDLLPPVCRRPVLLSHSTITPAGPRWASLPTRGT